MKYQNVTRLAGISKMTTYHDKFSMVAWKQSYLQNKAAPMHQARKWPLDNTIDNTTKISKH